MKKVMLGAVVGAGVMVGAQVWAASGISLVDETKFVYHSLRKFYDKDANVICYALTGGSTGTGISCLKNN